MREIHMPTFAPRMHSMRMLARVLLLCAGMGIVLFVCSFAVFPAAQAAGNFSYVLSGSALPGKSVELSLVMPEGTPAVSGFRCGVSLEGSPLICSKVKGCGAVSGSSLYVSQPASGPVCVYAGADGTASRLSGELIAFTLKIPENAAEGDVLTVKLWADQVCGENGKAPEGFSSFSQTVSIPVGNTGGDRLAFLKPDTGSLSPAFSPEVFSYTLQVPSSVKEVHFEAEAQNGAKITISRYRLQAAGKTTEIRITLTDEDAGKTVYVVTVHRGDEEAGAGTDFSGAGHSGKSSSKGETHSFGSAEGSFPVQSGASPAGSAAQPQSPLQILQNHLPEWTGILSLLFSAAALILALYIVCRKKSTKSSGERIPSGIEKIEDTDACEKEKKEKQEETAGKDHGENSKEENEPKSRQKDDS